MPGYWYDDRPSDAPPSYPTVGADTSNRPDWAGSGQGQGPPGQPATGPHIGYEPVVTVEEVINQPISTPVVDGRSAALAAQAAAAENTYLTGIAEMATDEYGRLRNIYTESGFDDQGVFQSGDPLLTFDDGQVVRQGGWNYETDPETGVTTQVFTEGGSGQLLSDLERMKLMSLKMGHRTNLGQPVSGLSQFGNELGSLIALDSSGEPIYNSEGRLIYTGLGKLLEDNWNQIITSYDDAGTQHGGGQGRYVKDLKDWYWSDRAGWGDYGGPGSWSDDWDYGFGSGGDSMSELARDYWFSESLADVKAREEERQKKGLGPAGMRASEMEQMYDKNFAAMVDPMADPMADPGFSEFAGGIRGETTAEEILRSKGIWEAARA